MRLPFVSIAAAVTLVATPCIAQDDPQATAPAEASAPSGPPQLVLAIAVDQLSADLFAQYRRHFTEGLARLQQGAVFPSGYQSHAATETCPGHATILTGTHPARNGIIANAWFDPDIDRDDKRIYCAEDARDPASSSRQPVVSAEHLRVPTLGGWMKRADPRSLNVAVSAKDRAAMMMGGRNTDAAYWLTREGFSTFPARTPSAGVSAVNRDIAGVVARGEAAMELPAWCAARAGDVPVGGFTIGNGRFALPAGDSNAWRVSPRADEATANVALSLVDEFRLGRDNVTDVLAVSFSATDYIGHSYGHQGAEMCIQLAALDRTIGTLMAALDARGIDYVAVLTADHGGLDAVERLDRQALPGAAREGAELDTDALAAAVTARTGIAVAGGPLLLGGVQGDIYVSAEVKPREKARVVRSLIELLSGHPQVAAVFGASELEAAPLPSGSPQDWTLVDRARASFDPERSGDVVVLLERAVSPGRASPGYVATHGSPWDYDRRVPILFWRKGLPGLEQPAPVETIDIAPTLAAVIGLEVPETAFDGRCLDIDGSRANICGQ